MFAATLLQNLQTAYSNRLFSSPPPPRRRHSLDLGNHPLRFARFVTPCSCSPPHTPHLSIGSPSCRLFAGRRTKQTTPTGSNYLLLLWLHLSPHSPPPPLLLDSRSSLSHLSAPSRPGPLRYSVSTTPCLSAHLSFLPGASAFPSRPSGVGRRRAPLPNAPLLARAHFLLRCPLACPCLGQPRPPFPPFPGPLSFK